MHWARKILCSIVIVSVGFMTVFCCCIKTAQASNMPEKHSCCPAKTDSSHQSPSIPCQHQFSKAEQAVFDSYEPHYIGKVASIYASAEQATVRDSASQISLAIDRGPLLASEVPLYLQSHKLRL